MAEYDDGTQLHLIVFHYDDVRLRKPVKMLKDIHVAASSFLFFFVTFKLMYAYGIVLVA